MTGLSCILVNVRRPFNTVLKIIFSDDKKKYTIMVGDTIYYGKYVEDFLADVSEDTKLHRIVSPDVLLDEKNKQENIKIRFFYFGRKVEFEGTIEDVILDDYKLYTWESVPTKSINKEKIADLFEQILCEMKLDLNDPNLRETPMRFAKMMIELTNGLFEEPPNAKDFEFELFEDSHFPVFFGPTKIVSVCSHHFLPILGEVFVEYWPTSGKVVGLSKLPRIVKYMAQKPMIQELYTKMLVKSIANMTGGDVFVYVKAKHMCTGIRGVKENLGYMVTYDSNVIEYWRDPRFKQFLKKIGDLGKK